MHSELRFFKNIFISGSRVRGLRWAGKIVKRSLQSCYLHRELDYKEQLWVEDHCQQKEHTDQKLRGRNNKKTGWLVQSKNESMMTGKIRR